MVGGWAATSNIPPRAARWQHLMDHQILLLLLAGEEEEEEELNEHVNTAGPQ